MKPLSQIEFVARIPELLLESAERFTSPQSFPLYIVVKRDGAMVAETFKTARAVETLLFEYTDVAGLRKDAKWYSEPELENDDHLYRNYLHIIELLNRIE